MLEQTSQKRDKKVNKSLFKSSFITMTRLSFDFLISLASPSFHTHSFLFLIVPHSSSPVSEWDLDYLPGLRPISLSKMISLRVLMKSKLLKEQKILQSNVALRRQESFPPGNR